jgi:indolepyruvate ferredoxin oxidoreductase
VEQAIELNGVAVEMNLQALRRGRQSVCDPEGLAAALEAVTPEKATQTVTSDAVALAAVVRAEPGSELARRVLIRVSDLIAYQNRSYALRYAKRVEEVRLAEERQVGGGTKLAEEAAFSLYKLMAYKDEYEVARLHLDSGLAADISGQFGADAKFVFMLHPPSLKALGMQRKLRVPGKAGVAMFKALASMKRLRGTPLDPFGRDHVRVIERELIAEYEALLSEIAERLTVENYPLAIEMAGLPDMVRGYDEIKLANVELYHDRLATLRAQFTDGRRVQQSLPVLNGQNR